MRCPICEAENQEQAVECERCGKVLRSASSVNGFAPPLEGLEQTLHATADADVEALDGLEPTVLDEGGLPLPDESIEVERTQVDASGAGSPAWSGDVDLDRGREEDADPRTPAPRDDGSCPFCGAAASGLVCDGCGRRRTRYVKPATLPGGEGEPQPELCPACYARVVPYLDGVRGVPLCSECGVPLPLREAV